MKVLFVCLGNICRSPAAEGIFQSKLNQLNLAEAILCDSAGTNGYHIGELPDPRMREHGTKRGYQFASRARQFSAEDFSDFDLILTMDDSNYTNVTSLARSQEDIDKVRRFCDYVGEDIALEVPDPYYGGASGFENVLDILETGCDRLLSELQKSTQK